VKLTTHLHLVLRSVKVELHLHSSICLRELLLNSSSTQVTLLSSICLWLYSPFLGFGRFFSFLILYAVGRTPLTGDQPVARPLPVQTRTQTQNKRIQTSMPQVGLEPTTPVFERAKTDHILDRVATVIGPFILE
jgi:hypothetical protein